MTGPKHAHEPTPPGGPAGTDACRPVEMDLSLGEQILRVTWADGRTSTYSAALLRRNCPCAACRSQRQKQSRTLLPVLSGAQAEPVELCGGHPVGNYALQFDWTDGHATGIYDFGLLRHLADRSDDQPAE